MKIVIDARFWGAQHTGLGIYTQKLVLELARQDKKNFYTLLVRDFIEDESLGENFRQLIVDVPPYSLKEQLLLPIVLYKITPDLVHFPSINIPLFFWGRKVLTVHDLIKHDSTGPATTTRSPILYWFKHLAYLLVFKWAVVSSKRIIVPSQAVSVDLGRRFNIPEWKIRVTYEASALTNSSTKTVKKNSIRKKFALYVGNAYPHKNLEFLLNCWKSIHQEFGVSLLLVSGRSVFAQRLRHKIKNESLERFVEVLDFLPEKDLYSLYREAEFFIFPSLMEGFGLPGLEAMSLGVPLICSDIPVFREIYGKAAIFFNPREGRDLQAKIAMLVNDSGLRRKLVEEGKNRAKEFSWGRAASETQKIYQEAVLST